MTTRRRFPLLLALAPTARADYARSNPQLQRVFGNFIAPCCWRESLLVHSSAEADKLRAEIEGDLAAGLSEDTIKAKLIKTYGKRILTMPEGMAGNLLNSAPWAAAALGATALTWFIHQSVSNHQKESES
jgi:cytochrome c-type biogenesis protein CcmH/NrfF